MHCNQFVVNYTQNDKNSDLFIHGKIRLLHLRDIFKTIVQVCEVIGCGYS